MVLVVSQFFITVNRVYTIQYVSAKMWERSGTFTGEVKQCQDEVRLEGQVVVCLFNVLIKSMVIGLYKIYSPLCCSV